MKLFATQSVARSILLAALFGFALFPPTASSAATITNIVGLRHAVADEIEAIRDIAVTGTVCAASPTGRELVLADDSGAALVQLESAHTVRSGQRVILSGSGCQLVSRNWGISLLRPPLVDNDGLHPALEKAGRAFLPAGRTPIRVEWFNGAEGRSLKVEYAGPGLERQPIPATALASGGAGLHYRYFEGRWFTLPNFRSLLPVAQGVTTNFDIGVCPNPDNVALEFVGSLEVALAGDYTFYLNSDDGARLYLGGTSPALRVVGEQAVPVPDRLSLGEVLRQDGEFRWGVVEGIVRSLAERADCLELELESGANRLRVVVVDRSGLQAALLLNGRVRVTGVCRSAFRSDGVRSFGLLEVASLRDLQLLQPAADLLDYMPVTPIAAATNFAGNDPRSPLRVAGRITGVDASGWAELSDASGVLKFAAPAAVPAAGLLIEAFGQLQHSGTNEVFVCGFWREQKTDAGAKPEPTALLTTAEQVLRLSRREAEQGWPVLIQGVITCDAPDLYYGSVIQDGTRGVFVKWSDVVQPGVSTQPRPRLGEFWEIRGRAQPGDFAPVVSAVKMRRLGEGQLPPPVRPTWEQLMSGSLDTQFVEMQGIITGVEHNVVVLLTHGGKIRVKCDNYTERELRRHDNSLVMIRGCLLASWDPKTHLMRPGQVSLANAVIVPAKSSPRDPFTLPEKNAADLLLFDVEAGAFHRVRMKGMILQERAGEFFMLNGAAGVRFVPRAASAFKPGTLMEVVGIPELGGPSAVLREALVRELGTAPLPMPRALLGAELFLPVHDATRVRVEAQLVGVRTDHVEPALELLADGRTFVAWLRTNTPAVAALEPGSMLELTGVVVAVGGVTGSEQHAGTVELLLDSAADVRVIARPPWWTPRRMLAVLGGLLAGLIFAALWITQLRRRVEERTKQLQREIHEREQAERLRQVAEEKSRIARDLHDDLGSSLTEISLLANVARFTDQASSQAGEQFGVIAAKAHTMVSALDVIVWAVDPEENNLQSLADYVAGYAAEFLAASGLECRFKIPTEFPDVTLDGRMRHELFLAVKEALNNVVRHAQARAVEFSLAMENNVLQIEVADDGRGFDASGTLSGHGVLNLQKRLADLGGRCNIRPRPGGGTSIEFQLPLRA